MRVEIEEYRGWVISFDTEKETFYAISDSYDRDATKQSYASCKKYVDDYIKENQEFQPFFVEGIPSKYSKGKIRLVGLRKDGLFTYEDRDGKKHTLSKYDEDSYMLINSDNDSKFKELDELKAQILVLHKQVGALEKTFIVKSLAEVKQNYIK